MKRQIKQKKNRIMIATVAASVLVLGSGVFALADEETSLHAGVGNLLSPASSESIYESAEETKENPFGAGVQSYLAEISTDNDIETLDPADNLAETEETAKNDDAAAEISTDGVEGILGVSANTADGNGITADGEILTDIVTDIDASDISGVQGDIVMADVELSVNVRKEPSEDSEVVGKLLANSGGEILERRDGWTKLRSGDVEGWTSDEFLLFGEEAEDLSKEAGKLTATVTTDTLKIRREMSTDSAVIDLAANGQELTAVEELGDWVSVKYNGEIGYVSAEFVTTTFTIPTGKTVEQIEAEERAKAEKEAAEKAAKSKKSKKSKGTTTTDQGAVDAGASDVTLLAALIQCEAGRESYEGQLAVGAVVMNRVRSGSYPGSVSAVITQPSQFPPATNGKVAAVVAAGPSSSCIQAAQAAISGQSNVGSATHFGRGGSGITIGNHTFW
ncbi:MAG: SH3 domain-containing protein [Lachnospiraceae bacterium]|nr:SH3 domain-containing protein [Lachnospiraceae bacterium]